MEKPFAKMREIDLQIIELCRLAGELGCVLYDIKIRNAGWAIQWWDKRRCLTKELDIKIPNPSEDIEGFQRAWNTINNINDVRLKEGLIIHSYYGSFSKMLEGEFGRIKHEIKHLRTLKSKG